MLIKKLLKTCAEHYCESEGQTMTAKTVKIGTPNNAIEVYKKPSIRRSILKSIAVVYCEENNLEMVQKS